MAKMQQLDRVYHFIMETFVQQGRAPHFVQIARALSMQPEQGKTLLHELMKTGLPGWLHPNTDLIASLAPFNNLPNHYFISIDGQQKWFGQ